ncbi:putative DNA-binding protein [Bartonella australis AUST/NH1]|uniref:Putative DNA-binding protein n=1 Tax=Bartonella australis (strain Aust/NH1) TaxID=1094489 RepID=M1N5E5_BARAA|nr:heme biosynthesis HemY N-terminal domain-containing protein [Bartonella australis]AGF75109.1 putative DNA-binding protein [Bartonella australis AUST/NH1]
MIRIFVYIFIVCVLGIVFGWVANHNGILVITFPHLRLTVSLLTALIAFVFLLAVLVFLWWLLGVIVSVPRVLSNYFRVRHEKRGHEALSQGLIAVFAGDYVTARKMEECTLKYLEGNQEPLVKLLQAQTLLLQTDSIRAIRFYEELKKEAPTRLAGLYGLFREAVNAKAYEAAQQYAEEALTLSPALLWANQIVLDRLSAEEQWDKALDIFNRAQNALPRSARFTTERNHTHALLLSGLALHLLKNYPVKARTAILKAHKFVPDFVPITVIAADILYTLNETRKADKMITGAWQKNPHPDLGAVYLKREEGAVGRLKKAKTLASYNKDTFESAFLVAKAALDAGEVELAKKCAQKALDYHPRESVYLLLADIEEAQGNDQGLVRQYLSSALRAERDPAWICDGVLFSSWSLVSPISGRLGCFEWKIPPCRPPKTLEADGIMLKEENKEDITAKIAFIEDKPLQELSPVGDELLHEVQVKNEGEEVPSQTRLNVDDPGIKVAVKSPSLLKKISIIKKRKL